MIFILAAVCWLFVGWLGVFLYIDRMEIKLPGFKDQSTHLYWLALTGPLAMLATLASLIKEW